MYENQWLLKLKPQYSVYVSWQIVQSSLPTLLAIAHFPGQLSVTSEYHNKLKFLMAHMITTTKNCWIGTYGANIVDLDKTNSLLSFLAYIHLTSGILFLVVTIITSVGDLTMLFGIGQRISVSLLLIMCFPL